MTPNGTIHFLDADISIWDEGVNPRLSLEERDEWERSFKRQVFDRIVRSLRRLGWTVGTWDGSAHYKAIAANFRICSKGDLKGELQLCGRHINFEMWQGINTPTRPDHGGRYEPNKAACMPYLLRLEMERTRRCIRDDLCKAFEGYAFDTDKIPMYRRPLQHTALECIEQHYANSWHFNGTDWDSYKRRPGMSHNVKSADDALLDHGQRVWFVNHKGRICEGVAYYDINNMWWVASGRYDYTNVASFQIFTRCPDLPRVRRNAVLRRTRLEQELKKAASALDFDRAKTLKAILYPDDKEVYAIWHKKHRAYFGIQYCGYRSSLAEAGHYTRAELRPYLGKELETEKFKAVRVAGHAEQAHPSPAPAAQAMGM